MKLLKRNCRTIYYSVYEATEPTHDEYGNEMGVRLTLSDPKPLECNVHTPDGTLDVEQFGINRDFERQIVTDNMDAPIDETSVLYIDKEPTKNSKGDWVYDYTVNRVCKSLNSVQIFAKRVEVS